MMLYVLPIMGGGNGAGAVPLSGITPVTGRSREEYYSTAIIPDHCEYLRHYFRRPPRYDRQKYARLSGEGELVRKASFKTEDDEKAGPVTHRETAVGMVLSTCWPMLLPENSAKHRRRLYSLLHFVGWF